MTERDVSLIDEGKTKREQFDAAWKAHGCDLYDSFEACAWEFWQASRRAALEEGYALGFNASGEGWNGEYPYRDLTKDPKWIKERDENLSAATSITSP